jgi:hypothetical protein
MEEIICLQDTNSEDVFLYFPDREEVEVWDEIGGHSRASLDYIAECEVVSTEKGRKLISKYNSIYDI